MIEIRGHSFSVMILCCIALHLWWAIIIAFDDSGTGATAVHALYRWFGLSLPIVLVSVALLAFVAVFQQAPWWIVLFLIPQEVLLVFSASGAITAIWLSQFADGVVRPRAFIANDVAMTILAAIAHTLAIVAMSRKVA